MSFKQWLIIWLLCVIAIPVVTTLNFLIDPFGYNKKFSFYNNVKVKNDERIYKFDHLKENRNYEAIILGTSKGAHLDPEYIKKYTNLNAFNASFSSGTVDEFLLFSKWIVNNMQIKLLVLEFEFYSFSDFLSNGSLPEELISGRTYNIFDYTSLELFKNTIKTIKYNFLNNQDKPISKIQQNLYAKGMQYDKSYFEIKDDFTLRNKHYAELKSRPIVWPGNKISEKRLNSLNEIINICDQFNVKLILVQGPSSYLQLRYDNYSYYLKLLLLLEQISKMHNIYFFNDFNELNYQLKYYSDNLHFNYDANKFIFERIFLGTGYGVKLTSDNFTHTKSKILNKLNNINLHSF